tara:strand:+ start:4158 stop:5312 length:1155 start_codon:yes stop_codon:yes gene_type:complete
MFSLKPEKKYKVDLQSPSKSLWSTFKKAFITDKNFRNFWINLDKSNLPEELVHVTNIFINSKSYEWVSKFWKHLIISDYKTLSHFGREEAFKRATLDHYTSSTFFEKKNLNETSKKLQDRKNFNLDLFKKHPKLDRYDSISYNLTLLVMYDLALKSISEYYDDINKEYYEDYSPSIEIDNKVVNQHLILSILEYEKIKILTNNINSNLRFLEIGAGYGRTANIVLSLNKKSKYIIVDIPPSIYVSRLNIQKHYSNLKIFSAFEIEEESKMEEAIDKNDVIFIFPHQLNLLKQNSIDVTLAIVSLLEMDKEIVKRYMNIVNRLSKSIYIKVFKNSGLPFSFYQFYRSNVRSDYFINEHWEEKFNENCLVPDFLMHMGYLNKNNKL